MLSQARNNLSIAKEYLALLEDAESTFRSEYDAVVNELHILTYAETSQLDAASTIEVIQQVAERAAAVGAPAEMMAAAQGRANELHASHMELLRMRAAAELSLLQVARVSHRQGFSACDALRTSIEHATLIRLTGDIYTQAVATLNALEMGELNRLRELGEATTHLETCMEEAGVARETIVGAGRQLRDFSASDALRRAIRRATAAGLDADYLQSAGHHLAPLEAAQRQHE